MKKSNIQKDLYSQKLERRYRATLKSDGITLTKKWPVACFGAANAFLVLIGPSMGGARKGEIGRRGGANRPYRKLMHIGQDVMNFDWGDHRKARWIRLCSEMLGSEQYVSTMTSLLNLDWQHSTSEKEIPDEYLSNGFSKYIWPLLCKLQPRIVSPLTNRVWNTVLPKIEEYRVQFTRCPVSLPHEPIFFKFPESDFCTMLIKPHNHPSRFLSYNEIAKIAKACRWFLKQEK